MDEDQAFAYVIFETKAVEREEKAALGDLSTFRALCIFMTGTAGMGKSRTARGIAGARWRRARAAAARELRELSEEEVRGACVLAAPTGCASFQMKFGATTLHRAFGLTFSNFCGPQADKSSPFFFEAHAAFAIGHAYCDG